MLYIVTITINIQS